VTANDHVIAVNDALGFELVPPAAQTVELTIADALGQGMELFGRYLFIGHESVLLRNL
jgi:hypothetical protein